MGPLKNFRLFSCLIGIVFTSVILVGGSPLQHLSSDSYDLKDDEIKNSDIYRLPNDVIPVSYELKMAPDLEKFTFAGQVNITVHVQFATDRIILHSKNLQIQNAIVIEAGVIGNATTSIPTTHTVDEKHETLIIKTEGKFKFNKNYYVLIKFQGTLESLYRGFYRASYTTDNNQTSWFVATQFEEMDARRAFPCFDEPRFRTPFTVYLARSTKHIAISNMPNEPTGSLPGDSLSNGLEYEKFQTTPPMPTYLVAFMVSDFKQLTDQNQDQRVRVFARPTVVEKGKYALKQAAKLLAYFEGYFGIPYPLPKLDIVAIPGFRGGMENWGMTVFDENMVLLNYDQYKILQAIVTTSISHEFAHLWFGDSVSPSWYDYIWLKDGFGTFFQFFATAAIEPTWNQEEIFVSVVTQHTFVKDIFFDRALTWPNRQLDDIKRSYNEAVSYNKGAIFIRMFELMFTPKTFQSALRRYLLDGQQNHQGLAEEKNLFDAFDKQVELDSLSHLPINVRASDIMKTWTENIGYPLITVTRSYEKGEVEITQTPYPRQIKTSDNRYQEQKWIVPLTFTTKSQLQFTNVEPAHWSFSDKPTILGEVKKSDWIIFNLKRKGFYRVNYDPENWQLIIDQLMQDHAKIHVLNRAQLIDDVLTLASDQLINCTIAGRLIKYLQKETSIIPWYPISLWFQKLLFLGKFNPVSLKNLKNQLRAFLEKPLKNFGCLSKSDDEITVLVKIQFQKLSNDLDINNCPGEMTQLHQKNYDNLDKIPQNFKPAVEKIQTSESESQCTWKNFFSDWKCFSQVTEVVLRLDNREQVPPSRRYVMLKKPYFKTSNVTTIVKFLDEIMPTLSNLDGSGIEFLESLLNSIDSRMQTEEQIEFIKKLEIKFESLDQKKYSKYTQMVKSLRINAEKKITHRNEFMEGFPNECLFLDQTSQL